MFLNLMRIYDKIHIMQKENAKKQYFILMSDRHVEK